VRVWSLPPRAAVAAADISAPRVVDLRAASPGHEEDKVDALSLATDATTLFAGMASGSVHIVDCDSGRMEAPLRTDRTAGAAVFCLTLVEFNSNATNCGGVVCGRLFVSHVNGIVSEWDLESRSCLTAYADARSGAGFAWSIAARIIPAASGQGVNGDKKSTTAESVGASGGGSSGGAVGRDGVIEFVTGHSNGTVRVCRAEAEEYVDRNAS
jgi:hypothetical protein